MNASASNALLALSDELARSVATTGPSVVYVDAHPRRDASGIAWDAHHVVTVAHAIEREDDIELLLGDGKTARAELAGRDVTRDVALLRTDATLQPAKRGDVATLEVGRLVLAIGRDEDAALAASFGIVSATGGPWRTWRGGEIDRFVRPDLSVYPAFSGGPLVDATGSVVGMNTWALSRRMALTIPVTTLERAVAELLASGGRLTRGYLGIAMQAIGLPDALRATHGIAQRSGAIVLDVAAGGPAEAAGVQLGDVVLALGVHDVGDSHDVQRALANVAPGTSQTLRILRGGAPHALPVTIGERPADED
jgi:S1-C subfamily serine protease